MFFSRLTALVFCILLTACDATMDDLSPSSEDLTGNIIAGSSGTQPGQIAPDFTLRDSLDNGVTLSSEYATSNAVVLYFTMWCPVCDSHMSYIRSSILPAFPNTTFYFVDYVTGSVSASRQAQISNGYVNVDVLVDQDQTVLNDYNATMGTTVVIDNSGTVLLNEDFRNGAALYATLQLIP